MLMFQFVEPAFLQISQKENPCVYVRLVEKYHHQMVLRSRLQRLVQVAVRPTEQTRCVEDVKS